MATESLGEYLRYLREAKGMTLRGVERESNGRIRSGYLSQLERSGITRPSPHILWTLAEVYDADYADLLRRANYEVPSYVNSSSALRGIPLKAIQNLNDPERRLVRDFVEMLIRHRDLPG